MLVACTYLFAYAYCITYVSGEVKKPEKAIIGGNLLAIVVPACLLYPSPSPRDRTRTRMPSSA